jgi:hypothetical protein
MSAGELLALGVAIGLVLMTMIAAGICVTACSRPRVRYDCYGPFPFVLGGTVSSRPNCKAGPHPRAPAFFFCARGTLALPPRCCGGDAGRLDRLPLGESPVASS